VLTSASRCSTRTSLISTRSFTRMPMPTTSTASTICAVIFLPNANASTSTGTRRPSSGSRMDLAIASNRPPGSSYPPIVEPHVIVHDVPFEISGEGGPITFEPLTQMHGDIMSLGFRIGSLAYCSDVSAFPQETADRLHDLDVFIIDALQYREHPSHFSLGQALEWIERLKPVRAVLTHMHIPLD